MPLSEEGHEDERCVGFVSCSEALVQISKLNEWEAREVDKTEVYLFYCETMKLVCDEEYS